MLRDVRQIEHEIRCYAHFVRRRYRTAFADLEELGRFDLLVDTPVGQIEVECKTVTEDTGSQIKTEMTSIFRRRSGSAYSRSRPSESPAYSN
jgi:hypothetical protein